MLTCFLLPQIACQTESMGTIMFLLTYFSIVTLSVRQCDAELYKVLVVQRFGVCLVIERFDSWPENLAA